MYGENLLVEARKKNLEKLEMENLHDFHDLCMQINKYILTDIFEKFLEYVP